MLPVRCRQPERMRRRDHRRAIYVCIQYRRTCAPRMLGFYDNLIL